MKTGSPMHRRCANVHASIEKFRKISEKHDELVEEPNQSLDQKTSIKN